MHTEDDSRQIPVSLTIGKALQLYVERELNIVIKDESIVENLPACVIIEFEGQPIAKIVAEIVIRTGADGGWYHAVSLIIEPLP